MPKTVEELVAERKNTGNTVYYETVLINLGQNSMEHKIFEVISPVILFWSVNVRYFTRKLNLAFHTRIASSKIISSNYQFIFTVGCRESSGALSTKSECIDFNKQEVDSFLKEDKVFFSCALRIKYVGHPRMRNKCFVPITFVPLLKNMFKNPLFSDFEFIVEGKEFKVHKCVMAAASPMLLKMFTIDMAENKKGESKIDHIKPEIFEAMLKFIYRAEAPTNVDFRELFAAAHYFQIEELKAVCEQEVHTGLSIENAADIFLWAFPYEELEDLKYDAWDVIKLKILRTGVETLDFEKIKSIVESVKVTTQLLDELRHKTELQQESLELKTE